MMFDACWILFCQMEGFYCASQHTSCFRFSEHIREHELHSQPSMVARDQPSRVLPILALNDVFVGESLSARWNWSYFMLHTLVVCSITLLFWYLPHLTYIWSCYVPQGIVLRAFYRWSTKSQTEEFWNHNLYRNWLLVLVLQHQQPTGTGHQRDPSYR